MIVRKYILIGVASVLVGLTSGCGGPSVRAEMPEKAPADSGQIEITTAEPKPEPIQEWAYRRYVDGLLYEGFNDLERAAANLRRAYDTYPDSYEIGFSLARVLFGMQKPARALAIAKGLKPQDGPATELVAYCMRAMGNIEGAKSAYLRLIELEPDHEAAYEFLLTYYQRQNDIDSTIWVYDKVAELQPDNYRLFNELGKLLSMKGEYIEAREAFKHSWEVNRSPANLLAGANLAELYEVTQQLDSAGLIYDEALKLDPANVLLHRQAARIAFLQDSMELALPHLRTISELSPNDLDASRQLGILYYSVDSVRQADSVFTSLVAAGDQDMADHYYLGQIATNTGDFQRAVGEYKILTEMADTLAESWISLAFAYQFLGDSTQELATYNRGLGHMKDDPNRVALLFSLGATLERHGQTDSSIAILEHALSIDSTHDQTLNYLGYMLADKGVRLEYAQGLIERAIEQQPSNPAYLDSYGWVNYRLGNYQDAIRYLETAASLDNDPVILDHLGDAYRSAGKMEDARKYWRQALEEQPDNQAIRNKLDQ